MKKIVCCLAMLCSLSVRAQEINITPKPDSVEVSKGNFTINANTVIVANDASLQSTVDFLNDYLKKFYGFRLKTAKSALNNYISIYTRRTFAPGKEGRYQLLVVPKAIKIEGETNSGSFYAIQSLIQLLPVPKAKTANLSLKIPCVNIMDEPRFAYRGMHLDVGRHFFSVDFIKRYIDFLALHKINYFHWHLTEDQGWRIEIKKYPNLTKTGAWRNGSIIGRYPGTGSDNTPHGGYYTQQQVKEVVAYAQKRYITVVPEIEMPGHSSAAIASYPYLSCFPAEPTMIPADMISQKSIKEQAAGRIKLVQETWGVFDDVFCAGKDSTFNFLEDVLDEVMALFPSPYIHVGGDECPKTSWKRCPLCQQRMKENGLKDEHELQSYFIQRIEKYINSKGRSLIGWDEILEGGLAPNATVMSWRGEDGGIAAAKQNHNVIMTPGNPVYFDHSQSRNEDSITIGGYNPLEKVYAYDPVPAVLNEEQGKYILGAQANVWTEYMQYPSKIEYMILPRIAALSEAVWTKKEKKSWTDFETRIPGIFKRYDLWKANYSKAYYDIETSVAPAIDNNGVLWKLQSRNAQDEIKTYEDLSGNNKDYTMISTKAEQVRQVKKQGLYIAECYHDKKLVNKISQQFIFNKATGKNITLANPASKSYPGDGDFTLVNGIQNTKGMARSNEFLGFNGKDCDATIDLGKETEIKEVTAHILEQNSSWIYRPQSIEVFISNDGQNFTSLSKSDVFIMITPLNKVGVSFAPIKTRYVRVQVKNYGKIPDGNPGAGNNAWLFVDEIEIN